MVAGIIPSPKALTSVSYGLGAICLNANGLEAVRETSALQFLVDIFSDKKYVLAMNEGIVALANAVEELLRHVSSIRVTDGEDKENMGACSLVDGSNSTADGLIDEQCIQLLTFHVMVLVHGTMENSETC